MSFSRLSRGRHFLSCAKVSIRQAPLLSRNLGAVGSRYSYTGASNSNVYGTPFGYNCRGFVSKHGYNLRIYSANKSYPMNFGQQYSTHAAATERKSKKMLFN